MRGLNGPSGFVFLSVDGQPHVTKFVWIINMDLKGWVPSMLIDKVGLAGKGERERVKTSGEDAAAQLPTTTSRSQRR